MKTHLKVIAEPADAVSEDHAVCGIRIPIEQLLNAARVQARR
jgi:hypothetical protein